VGSEKSITNEEYSLAIKRGIPIIVCVDKQVDTTLIHYKKNPTADFSSYVDDIRIYHFVEYIKSASEDNWVFQFENVNDIKNIIKSQFSYYLLLFSKSLLKEIAKEKKVDSSKLTFAKFPSNLDNLSSKKLKQDEETAFRNGLKELHKSLSSILTSEGINDNKSEKLKAIWVIAKYGKLNWEADDGTTTVKLAFKNEDEDCHIAVSLQTLTNDLIEKFDNDEAFELFKKLDFRLYMK